MTNSTLPPNLIEFPCKYPFKIIGQNIPDLVAIITNILKDIHVKYYEQSMTCKPSSNNNYISINIEVDVTDRAHLEDIYQALNACEYIKMIL